MKNEKSINLYRTTNANDYLTTDNKFQVFPDGVSVCKIKIIQGVDFEKRKKYLYSIGVAFLSLNNTVSQNTMFNYLQAINSNKSIIVIPIKASEIMLLIKQIWIYKDEEQDDEGNLIPINNHIRKIIFNDEKYEITKEEKQQITNKEMGKVKSEQTKVTISNAISDWNYETLGKITYAKLAKVVDMSLKTINNHSIDFKKFIQDSRTHISKLKC